MSEFRVRYPYGGKRFSLSTQHGQEWSMAPLLTDSFSAELGAAGHVIHRYAGGLTWDPVAPMNAELAA